MPGEKQNTLQSIVYIIGIDRPCQRSNGIAQATSFFSYIKKSRKDILTGIDLTTILTNALSAFLATPE